MAAVMLDAIKEYLQLQKLHRIWYHFLFALLCFRLLVISGHSLEDSSHTYGNLEMFLMGLDLKHLMPKFQVMY